MIVGKKVLALVPARGGSKGVPRKNLRSVDGKPLIAWSIEAARGATAVDRVVLSTDDEQIAGVARDWGCEVPFIRPAHLATDEAASIDVVLHALDQLPDYEVLVLLQPTSPLRTSHDIDAALQTFAHSGAPACVSVTEAEQSPYWMFNIGKTGCLRSVTKDGDEFRRRQDIPAAYVLNGAIYIAQREWLQGRRSFLCPNITVAYEMPTSRSLDIDTEEDFILFEQFLRTVRHA